MGYLLKRGKIWYARIGTGGKDRWFSTGQADKGRAREWLVHKERELRGEHDVDGTIKILLVQLMGLPEHAQDEKRREIV